MLRVAHLRHVARVHAGQDRDRNQQWRPLLEPSDADMRVAADLYSNGLGLAIMSTSDGVLTDRQARSKGVGGEVLALVW